MLVEFSGTPSSGKNSIIKHLKEICKEKRIEILEESAISSEFDFDIQNHELRTLWRILDTYLRIVKVINNDSPELKHTVIFNRGLFDRIAWARFLAYKNQYYEKVANDAENNLKRYLHKIDIIFLMLSPYEKVRARRFEQGRGSNELFVNQHAISLLNRIYIEVFEEFRSKINIVTIDDTEKDINLEEKASYVQAHLAPRRQYNNPGAAD